MIALVSAKGSPGVTTTALALMLTAPGPCLLAECDPAGGDVLAGYLQGSLPAARGLAPLAVAQLRGRLPGELDSQLVDLGTPPGQRLLLPGVTDPAQSATVASVWEAIAANLRAWQDGDAAAPRRVVLDCGRWASAHFGTPLLTRADRVLLVVRADLPSVSAAVPTARGIAEQLGGRERLGLLVVGQGPYRPVEVARQLDLELVASLPADPRTAERLSFGGPVDLRAPLLRAAANVHARLAGGDEPPAVPPQPHRWLPLSGRAPGEIGRSLRRRWPARWRWWRSDRREFTDA